MINPLLFALVDAVLTDFVRRSEASMVRLAFVSNAHATLAHADWLDDVALLGWWRSTWAGGGA